MIYSLLAVLLSLLLTSQAWALDLKHSGNTYTGSTLADPTITGTVAGGASYTAPTLTSPTVTGTLTGTPTWASAQTMPGLNLTGTLTFTDATIFRRAANSLALANGTSGQILRIYNTRTDDDNGEYLMVGFASNIGRIVSAANGTGTARNLVVGPDAADWTFGTDSHLIPGGGRDNQQDLGASATQIRSGYFGTSVAVGTTVIGVGTTFAALGTPANGRIVYCSDCDAPTLVNETCTSAGAKTGAIAMRLNSLWKCH